MFKNEEGFSLLELVVAVGVAGIIAAVALPTFAGLQAKAEANSATYAASASAAEALANSTLGTTGSTGGNSSSASSNTGGTSTFNPASGLASDFQGFVGSYYTLDTFTAYGIHILDIPVLSQSDAVALTGLIAANPSATITVAGNTYNIVAAPSDFGLANGNYAMFASGYGDSYRVRISLSNPSVENVSFSYSASTMLPWMVWEQNTSSWPTITVNY